MADTSIGLPPVPLNNVGKFEGAGVDLTVAGDKALAPLEEGLVCSCAYKFLSNKNIKFLRHFKIAGMAGHVELFINRVIAYRVSNRLDPYIAD